MDKKEEFLKEAKKMLEEHGVDYDNIDLTMLFDSKLNITENLELIKEIGHISNLPDKEKVTNEMKEMEEKNLIEYQKQLKKEEDDFKRKILAGKTDEVFNNFFKGVYVKMDTINNSKKIHGLMVIGDAGIGKSFNIRSKLIKDGFTEMGKKKYVLQKGHITPLDFYHLGFENPDSVLIIDDIENILENKVSYSLLLAMLETDNKRIVQYKTTSEKLEVSKFFEFKGKLIICLNRVPNTHLDALNSRCYTERLSNSLKDKLELCYALARIENIPIEIVDYIKELAKPEHAIKIDLRLVQKLDEIRKNKSDWKEEFRKVIEDMKDIVRMIADSGIPYREQIEEFKRITGKSASSYDRIKRKLEKLSDDGSSRHDENDDDNRFGCKDLEKRHYKDSTRVLASSGKNAVMRQVVSDKNG